MKHIESKDQLFERLLKYAEKIHVGDSIMQELSEQKVFMSTAKINNMMEWSYQDFVYWYEN